MPEDGKFRRTMQILIMFSTLLTQGRSQALLPQRLEQFLWQEIVESFFQTLKHQRQMLNILSTSTPNTIFLNMDT